MNASLRVAVLSLAVVALGACASMDERTSAAPAAQAEMLVSSDRLDVDHEYVARVETIARRRGIGVTWVHPPYKKVRAENRE